MKLYSSIILACAILLGFVGNAENVPGQVNPDAKLHRFSTTIEKERPELDEETRRLIAAYRNDQSEANRSALKAQVERNYDAVVARKKAKLEELKRTAKEQKKIDEMQIIVDEMLRNREQRVENTMLRFTDSRLRPGLRERSQDGYQQVLGTNQDISIGYAPVTNEDYAKFIAATGHKSPTNWEDGKFPAYKEDCPVTNVRYDDAIAYCQYLTEQAGEHWIYRLPTEAEWEAAAGHMPKDADFNCGENSSPMPVHAYEKTISACGAIDMWGNVWEWTSTKVDDMRTVKGGAWDSPRTDCRTESRGVARDPKQGYANVGFRVIRENSSIRPRAPKLDGFVRIPMNPEFSFARALSVHQPGMKPQTANPGEKSPISEDYFLAIFPVTNGEYYSFCKNTGHKMPQYWQGGTFPKGKEKHPVLEVSIDDVNAYCLWLSQKYPGWTFRLPTEAEWENAASGTKHYLYAWGNDSKVSMQDGVIVAPFNFNGIVASAYLKKNPKQEVTFFHDKSTRKGEKTTLEHVISVNSQGAVKGWVDHKTWTGFIYTDLFRQLSQVGGYTTPVDYYPSGKNPYGIFDMCGNCWEWTSSVIKATNGAERGKEVNAIRGGSWYANMSSCQATFRGEGRRANGCYNTVGFRLVAVPATK